jgi:glutaredoxin
MFDVQHREHLAPSGADREDVDNWIEYSQACVDDSLVKGVAKTAWMFHVEGYLIHFVSGRNEEAMKQTQETLIKHGVHFDEIRLHKADDLRHNGEYKAEYINQLKERGFEPVLMFEDHVEVCEMIEALTGVPCVTVKPRYVDSVGVSFNLNQHELVSQ